MICLGICFPSLSHKDRRRKECDLLASQTASTLGDETNSPDINDPNDNTEFPFLTSNLLAPSKRENFWKCIAQEDVCYLIPKIKAASKGGAWAGGSQRRDWTGREEKG